MTKLINGFIHVVSYYLISNLIAFEFVNFNTIIIHVMLGLTNIVKYIYNDMIRIRDTNTNCHLYSCSTPFTT